jgi:protein-S-isoprenylcysteine O-methyltransferase Ste14
MLNNRLFILYSIFIPTTLIFIETSNDMSTSTTTSAGIDRSHNTSVPQKLTFALGHLVIVLFSVWLVYGNGWSTIGHAFGREWHLADIDRAGILLVCIFIYWLRHVITLFYLLKRKVEWSEALGLLVYIALFETGLLLIGGGAFRDYAIGWNGLDTIALVLYLFGSYLNTASEVQRKKWKADASNKGHIYTGGLFRYSMHINYFGDTVLFTGWSLFTHNIWVMIFPVLIGLSFVYYHIPGLDAYLAQRYGDEFKFYEKKTKKFIPFVY